RVVGRKVVGGGEEAFPSKELNTLGKEVTGRAPVDVSRSDARSPLQGDDGGLATEFAPDGWFLGQHGILLADDLGPEAAFETLGHEIGHSMDVHSVPPKTFADYQAGRFGTRPSDPQIKAQLERVYRDLHAPWVEHFTPTDHGYTGDEAPAEL